MRFSLRHFLRARYTRCASRSAASTAASDLAASSSRDDVTENVSVHSTATSASACGHACHSRKRPTVIERIALPLLSVALIVSHFFPAFAPALYGASAVVTAGAVAAFLLRNH